MMQISPLDKPCPGEGEGEEREGRGGEGEGEYNLCTLSLLLRHQLSAVY